MLAPAHPVATCYLLTSLTLCMHCIGCFYIV